MGHVTVCVNFPKIGQIIGNLSVTGKKKILYSIISLFVFLLSSFSLPPPYLYLSLPLSPVQHQCLQGALCPVAAAPTAYCSSCDLDPSTTTCTWVLSAHTTHDISSTTDSPSINATYDTLITGLSINTNRGDITTSDTYSHTHTENLQSEGTLCPSHEEVVYSGDANRYTYTGKVCVSVCVCVFSWIKTCLIQSPNQWCFIEMNSF